MKKTLCLILFIILFPLKILANDLNIEYQNGIYGNKVLDGRTYYGQLGYIFLNNEIAYCLEPYKLISNNYKLDNSFLNNFTLEDKKYFEEVSYFGYGYPEHNSVYYYMASQELIWRRITNQNVYWTTKSVTKGDIINIDSYKNEIISLINNYNKKPSFDNNYINGNYRDTIVLSDNNNVLSSYNIINDSKNIVWKENNKLYIKIMTNKESKIKFVKNISNGKESKSYVSDGQAIGVFGFKHDITSEILVKATNKFSSRINIQFKDKENNKNIEGTITFKIKNNDNTYFKYNDIEEFKTDSSGKYISEFYLEEGNYEIEVIDVPNYYILKDNNFLFDINEDSKLKDDTLYIEDYIDRQKAIINIERVIEIIKKSDQLNYDLIPVSNIGYGIYASNDIYDPFNQLIYKKDQFIGEVITNDSGIGITQVLPLGKYYIKEIKNGTYEPDISIYESILNYSDKYTKIVEDKIYIQTNYNYLNINIKVNGDKYLDEQNKCDKEVVDLENITYGIYSNDLIYQNNKLLFSKDELIMIFNTNKDGTINEKVKLPYGNYYIKELSELNYKNKFKNYLYEFNLKNKNINIDIYKELESFCSILEKSELIENKIEVKEELQGNNISKLPNTSNIYLNLFLIILVTFIIGIFLIIYSVKK